MKPSVAKRALICDDDTGGHSFFQLVSLNLNEAGFEVFRFNGFDEISKLAIKEANRFASILKSKLDGDGIECLLMDLRWWTNRDEGSVFLGLDVLERLIPVLPRHLPLEHVAVISKWARNPDVVSRLEALGIPERRRFWKYGFNTRDWNDFLASLNQR